MIEKFVREYFFPAQHMHKFLYSERGGSSLVKSIRSYSSVVLETATSKGATSADIQATSVGNVS